MMLTLRKSFYERNERTLQSVDALPFAASAVTLDPLFPPEKEILRGQRGKPVLQRTVQHKRIDRASGVAANLMQKFPRR